MKKIFVSVMFVLALVLASVGPAYAQGAQAPEGAPKAGLKCVDPVYVTILGAKVQVWCNEYLYEEPVIEAPAATQGFPPTATPIPVHVVPSPGGCVGVNGGTTCAVVLPSVTPTPLPGANDPAGCPQHGYDQVCVKLSNAYGLVAASSAAAMTGKYVEIAVNRPGAIAVSSPTGILAYLISVSLIYNPNVVQHTIEGQPYFLNDGTVSVYQPNGTVLSYELVTAQIDVQEVAEPQTTQLRSQCQETNSCATPILNNVKCSRKMEVMNRLVEIVRAWGALQQGQFGPERVYSDPAGQIIATLHGDNGNLLTVTGTYYPGSSGFFHQLNQSNPEEFRKIAANLYSKSYVQNEKSPGYAEAEGGKRFSLNVRLDEPWCH